MKEISQERAMELDAAWKDATYTQRLSMPRMSWFAADSVTYYEEQPSKLELMAADRIAALEAVLGEARLQLEYLHEKFQPTGSGNAVLARINAALAAK